MKVHREATIDRIRFGARVGIERQIQNIERNRQPGHGASNEFDWQYHIEGALAEMIVADWKNIPWDGNLGKLKADDVGSYQVRGTKYRTGSLVLHPSDPDDKKYILVVGVNGSYDIVGWIWGYEGKKPCFWGVKKDPDRPAFWVPQGALRKIETLDID